MERKRLGLFLSGKRAAEIQTDIEWAEHLGIQAALDYPPTAARIDGITTPGGDRGPHAGHHCWERP